MVSSAFKRAQDLVDEVAALAIPSLECNARGPIPSPTDRWSRLVMALGLADEAAVE